MITYDKIFKLTNEGETLFNDVFLNQMPLKNKNLINQKYAVPVDKTKAWKVHETYNSFEVARELVKAFGGKNKCFEYQNDLNIWKWLSLALFEMIVQSDKSGNKKTKIEKSTGKLVFGQSARYDALPTNDYRAANRHLIRTPVLFYANLGKDSEHILNNKLYQPGEIREQFTQSPYFNRKCFARVFKKLYWNPDKSVLKKGSGGKGQGGSRDLVRVLKQLMVTQCLENMDEYDIVSCLPEYFSDKWV